jgi:hypothetical protein
MKILLTNRLSEVKVDDDMFEHLSKSKWYEVPPGYIATTDGSGHRFIHHVVLGMIGKVQGYEVHHKDGDRRNNCRDNLELLPIIVHKATRGPQKGNTSGYKGVTSRSCRRGWRAQIMVNYQNIGLGTFSTPEEAARAYDKKTFELYGKHAYLNFPDDYSTKQISDNTAR